MGNYTCDHCLKSDDDLYQMCKKNNNSVIDDLFAAMCMRCQQRMLSERDRHLNDLISFLSKF